MATSTEGITCLCHNSKYLWQPVICIVHVLAQHLVASQPLRDRTLSNWAYTHPYCHQLLFLALLMPVLSLLLLNGSKPARARD